MAALAVDRLLPYSGEWSIIPTGAVGCPPEVAPDTAKEPPSSSPSGTRGRRAGLLQGPSASGQSHRGDRSPRHCRPTPARGATERLQRDTSSGSGWCARTARCAAPICGVSGSTGATSTPVAYSVYSTEVALGPCGRRRLPGCGVSSSGSPTGRSRLPSGFHTQSRPSSAPRSRTTVPAGHPAVARLHTTGQGRRHLVVELRPRGHPPSSWSESLPRRLYHPRGFGDPPGAPCHGVRMAHTPKAFAAACALTCQPRADARHHGRSPAPSPQLRKAEADADQRSDGHAD